MLSSTLWGFYRSTISGAGDSSSSRKTRPPELATCKTLIHMKTLKPRRTRMRFTRILTALILMVLVFLSSRIVSAQSIPQQNLQNTALQGYVLGSGSAGIRPIDWALIKLKNEQQSFEVFSGITGFYQIYLPGGTYNITVNVPVDPSYLNYSTTLMIPNGTTTIMNFQLQQVLPVPELHAPLTSVILSAIGTCLIARKTRGSSDT